MKNRLSTYWRLFWHFRKLRLMTMMEYRGDFFFWTFISTMWAVLNFFSFSMIAQVNGQIGGWPAAHVYVLLSVFTMLDAFIWDWIYHNMDEYRRLVVTGEFTFVLLKPVSPEFLLLLQQNAYNNVTRFILGFATLLYWVHKLQLTITYVTLGLFVLLFMTSILFVASIWFMLATLTLWLERIDNINEIVPNLRQLWQVPGSVYQGVVSSLFTYVIPIALVVTLPSQAILGVASFQLILFYVGLTAFLAVLSQRFFRYSLTKFQGVGG